MIPNNYPQNFSFIGTPVYLPDELKVVHKLTYLKSAYCTLLTDLKESVEQVLDSCSEEQNKKFISSLQNYLDGEDFTDFQTGYKLLKGEVSLLNVQELRSGIVMLLPQQYR